MEVCLLCFQTGQFLLLASSLIGSFESLLISVALSATVEELHHVDVATMQVFEVGLLPHILADPVGLEVEHAQGFAIFSDRTTQVRAGNGSFSRSGSSIVVQPHPEDEG
jgi:hypothetical protein